MELSPAYHRTTKPEKLMEIVDETAARIKNWMDGQEVKPTHIVATGSSGQAIAWPVSYKLGLPVCIVRKESEKSHAGNISGTGDLGNYIIIDDLIDSGNTIRRVLKTINDVYAEKRKHADLYNWADPSPIEPKCAAIFLYQSGEIRDDDRADEFRFEGYREVPVYTSTSGRSW